MYCRGDRKPPETVAREKYRTVIKTKRGEEHLDSMNMCGG